MSLFTALIEECLIFKEVLECNYDYICSKHGGINKYVYDRRIIPYSSIKLIFWLFVIIKYTTVVLFFCPTIIYSAYALLSWPIKKNVLWFYITVNHACSTLIVKIMKRIPTSIIIFILWSVVKLLFSCISFSGMNRNSNRGRCLANLPFKICFVNQASLYVLFLFCSKFF